MLEVIDIPTGHELRIHNPYKEEVKVQLMSGVGDLFGTPLVIDKPLSTLMYSFAIYALQDVQVKLVHSQASSVTHYQSNSSTSLLNSALAINIMTSTPRKLPHSFLHSILITGAPHSGKTALCKFLLNTLTSRGYRPYFIDLNLETSKLSPPGTLSMTQIQGNFTDFQLLDTEKVVYFLGEAVLSKVSGGFKKAAAKLAASLFKGFLKKRLERKLQVLEERKKSVADEKGFEEEMAEKKEYSEEPCDFLVVSADPQTRRDLRAFSYLCYLFKATAVVVNDSEQTYQLFKKELNKEVLQHSGKRELDSEETNSIEVLKTERSNAISNLSFEALAEVKTDAFRLYFYGPKLEGFSLSPHRRNYEFKDFQVFRRNKSGFLPGSALPLEQENKAQSLFTRVNLAKMGSHLENTLLVVSSAKDPEELEEAPIFGFLLITSVNMEKKRMICMTIVKEELPNNVFILSDFKMALR